MSGCLSAQRSDFLPITLNNSRFHQNYYIHDHLCWGRWLLLFNWRNPVATKNEPNFHQSSSTSSAIPSWLQFHCLISTYNTPKFFLWIDLLIFSSLLLIMAKCHMKFSFEKNSFIEKRAGMWRNIFAAIKLIFHQCRMSPDVPVSGFFWGKRSNYSFARAVKISALSTVGISQFGTAICNKWLWKEKLIDTFIQWKIKSIDNYWR